MLNNDKLLNGASPLKSNQGKTAGYKKITNTRPQ